VKVRTRQAGVATAAENGAATAKNYSIGRVARSFAVPRPPAALMAAGARFAPLVVLVAAALLLVVSDFLTLREIKAVTAVPPGGETAGGAHHGYALVLIGVAMLPMAVGATLGGSRPAAVAGLALALAAAGIVLLVDLPALDETGLIGRTYDLAKAHPKAGFYVECAGTALALAGGLAVLRMRPAARRRRAAARPRRPASP
jgi:hypothetical protein